MDTLTHIVDDIIDHITVLKELGERTVEMDPQVVRDISAGKATRRTPQTQLSAVPPAPGVPKKREPLSRAVLQSNRPLSPEERTKAMQNLLHEMKHCFDCGLCKNRTSPVVGQGNLNSPDVMFLGAAPDAGDDTTGTAFSGPDGELLSKMIAAMGYKREDVFLTNTCKCRTPNDRAPTMDEMAKCSHYLEEQVKIVRPKIIVVLGEHANKGLFHNQMGASQPQGTWTKYHGIPVMPTFHPKYILRFSNDAEGQQKELKRSVWSALKGVMLQLTKVAFSRNQS